MGYKINRIMMRPGGVETQVRPPKQPRTFTISWTEQSDMSSGWTYSDDATGLTAGDSAFDEFFGYSAVKLAGNGTESAEVAQTTPGTLDITQLGTLTSGDNVMIKFPVRGIKMGKSGSTVTLSITDGLGREAEGYQYYAHCTGTLSSPGTPKDAFYLGAYKGYVQNGYLLSLSGKTPTGNVSPANFCTYAKANGTGYNAYGFYQRQYINALYIMKYGNPNCQSTVGYGYCSGNCLVNTGGTNSQTNATYGATGNQTTQCKLFGLEDRWGGIGERVGGVYNDSSKVLYTQLSGWSGNLSGGETTGTTITQTSSYFCLSSIAGNNKAMFAPIGTANNSAITQYYCDAAFVDGSRLLFSGGSASGTAETNRSGIFKYQQDLSSSAYTYVGARLMYL